MTTFKQSTNWTHQFLMVLTSDHISGATGKNGSLVVKLGKNGATGVTAAGVTAEVDSTNLPGVYSIAFTPTDMNTLGSLALAATATGCDPTNEFHRIDSQIFPDLLLDGSGRPKIFSNVIQNTQFLLPFIMTVNGVPTTGITGFSAQRSIGGGGFSACANSVTELASGWYTLLLAATDTNGAVIEVHITATSADDRNITIYTQP